jgi:hypothetical protein
MQLLADDALGLEIHFARILAAAQAGGEWGVARALHRKHPHWRDTSAREASATPTTVVGETFIRVVRNVEAFEGDAAAFRTWLFTIARNIVTDDARAAARMPSDAAPTERVAAVGVVRGQGRRLRVPHKRITGPLAPGRRWVSFGRQGAWTVPGRGALIVLARGAKLRHRDVARSGAHLVWIVRVRMLGDGHGEDGPIDRRRIEWPLVEGNLEQLEAGRTLQVPTLLPAALGTRWIEHHPLRGCFDPELLDGATRQVGVAQEGAGSLFGWWRLDMVTIEVSEIAEGVLLRRNLPEIESASNPDRILHRASPPVGRY